MADRGALAALFALLVWAPVAGGAYRGWPLAILQLLVLLACWLAVLGMIERRRLEWRRTAADVPLLLLIGLVLLQLAIGNRALADWALAAPETVEPGEPAVLPSLLWTGTLSPGQTLRSLRLFLTYVAVYALVVTLVRTRARLDGLVRMLLGLGGVLAFAALVDHLAGGPRLLAWTEPARPGRLAGTFVNPDHFAAWLEMLVCLGVGYVMARAAAPGDRRSTGDRAALEWLARRYLPMVAIGVMGVACVFTLSRGAIASLAAALTAMLLLYGLRGGARPSLVVVGALLAVVATYGAWIGFEPLLERLRSHAYASRWHQLWSSLGMLADVPLLGVGLGAYRDVYFRYQPADLGPGAVYFPFAHNDLLQLAVELGLVGAALCLVAGWRVAADLAGAHLLGRARCPVGGGERSGARRSDPWSVGVGTGALAAVFAMVVHSAFDFGARIPANGVLAAACLGMATAALHTRFTASGARLVTAVVAIPLDRRRWTAPVAVGVAALAALACVPSIVRTPLVEASLAATDQPAPARIERALALAPADPEARWARARLRTAQAREVWESGQTPDGTVLRSWAERRAAAQGLVGGAIDDLTAAIGARPSDPFLHEALALAHGQAAALGAVAAGGEPDGASDQSGASAADWARHRELAFAALARAIALAPENPYLRRSLAGLALGPPQVFLPVALRATREAIARDPALLTDLATRLLPHGLGPAEWAMAVPDSPADRLELGAFLDSAGLGPAAEEQYRRAAALLPPPAAPLARVPLARLLVRRGDARAALEELDREPAGDRREPELVLARAQALRAAGDDASALDEYRAALAAAEARAGEGPGAGGPLLPDDRLRALADRLLGGGDGGVGRYRRALAEYLVERRLWSAAAREWRALIVQEPRDAEAHFLLATALDGMDRSAEALELYRRAVALDGASARYRMALGRALWRSEQYYQAVNEWREAVRARPDDVAARLALAAGYARTGDPVRALEQYRQVLLIAPDNAEARRALGRSAPAAR